MTLPEMDIQMCDRIEAAKYPDEISRFVNVKLAHSRRQLKASKQREKELKGLLTDAGRYIAGACSGTRETILLQRIKAAVTGE